MGLKLVAAVERIDCLDRGKPLTSHCAIVPTVHASVEREEQDPIPRQERSEVRAVWIQATHALARSLQPNTQALQRWFRRVAPWRRLRTALAILSALMFCPAVLSTLTRISVTPKNQNINIGQTQQYRAMSYASKNNITDQLTWSSSSASVATINSSGLATAVAARTTTISATLSGKTSSTSLTVSNPVAGGVFCGGKNATATLPKCDPNNPTSNTVFDTTMPDISAYTVVQVMSHGNLQSAINNASCSPNGTLIKLQAGTTFSGHFTLPNKTCATGQWVIIQSGSANLPAPGTRVDPTVAGFMPKIQSIGGAPSISANSGANHYRFIGVEFNALANADTVALISLDNGNESNFIFDRCYIHGNADTGLTHDYRRGISVQMGGPFAAIDSYINQFHSNNLNSGADTQAIWLGSTTGPIKIVNNYLSASGENVMAGGTESFASRTPSDLEIRHNHFFKPPSWKANAAVVVKNIFELKNAQRILLDGNVFEYSWLSAQIGFCMVFTPTQSSDGPHAVVNDLTVTHNIIRHCANGMQVISANIPGGTGVTRALFQNNIYDDISATNWGGPGDGRFAQTGPNGGHAPSTITIDHNTILQTGFGGGGDGAYFIYESGNASFNIGNFQWTNNIANHGSLGIFSEDQPEGTATLSAHCKPYVWKKNVFIHTSNLSSQYPSGTFFSTQVNVGFVNFSGGDYHLQSSSRYHHAGTDGKDIGADIDSINSATVGVIQFHE